MIEIYMKKLILLIIFLSFEMMGQQPGQLADTPCPMYRYDQGASGRAKYAGPRTAKIKWTKDFNYGVPGGPVIDLNGNLIFGGNGQFTSKSIYCYSKEGELLWEYDAGEWTIGAIMVTSDSLIVFVTMHHINAIDHNGQFVWKYKPPSDPSYYFNIDDEGNLYFQSGVNSLICYRPYEGIKWVYEFESDNYYLRFPIISNADSLVYFMAGDHGLSALDFEGNLKWTYPCQAFENIPVLNQRGNIILQPKSYQWWINGWKILEITPEGELFRTTEIDSSFVLGIKASTTVDLNGNWYYNYSDNKPSFYLVSMDSLNNTNWEAVIDQQINSPIVSDAEGKVYFSVELFDSTYIYCFDSDGLQLWKLGLDWLFNDCTFTIDSEGTLYIALYRSSLSGDLTKTLIAISDNISGMEQPEKLLSGYTLAQNYPNPFNPETTIEYTLEKREQVNLKVYDLLGRELAVLVNEVQEAGSRRVRFAAGELPAGVYFYTLRAGDFVQTKKMCLLK